MPPRLTQLRLNLLRLIARLTRDQGGPPSAAELARAAHLTEATISFHLKALAELGLIDRTGARGRLILTERARTAIQDGIPIYGQIAAGAPILAEQTPDHHTPSLDQLLGVKDGDFLLQVRGDSMTGIGVMDGDYVLVRPTLEVLDGEVAVVLIPGENAATLKRVYVFGDEAVLISENPDHPRRTYPAADVHIQGRMVARLGLAWPPPPDAEGLTVAGRTPSLTACVLLAPWPLAHVRRQHPGVPVAVLSEGRRVLQTCPLATQAGVTVGMRETAALSRCPDLHAEVVPAPEAEAIWEELLEQLYARFSDRVDGGERAWRS